jgi:hypothetical protein
VVFTIPSIHPKDLPPEQLVTLDVEEDVNFEDFAMTVEVIGTAVGVGGIDSGEKDSLGADFMPLKTKPSEGGARAADTTDGGGSVFMNDINK